MSPVLSLGKPDDFIRIREIAPVRTIIAAFVIRFGSFLKNIANLARCCIRNSKLRFFVVTGSRDKGELRGVGTPLHIRECAGARYVIAKRRAMRIRRHLQPDDARCIDVDNYSLDPENVHVTRQRIFPCFKIGMSDSRVHEVHFTNVASIMLKRCDLPGIGRPQKNRTIALCPAGVVSGVTKIFDAIFGQLCLLAGGGIAHP